MSTSVAVSPFVPGYGGLPPYLAGRHREQNELRRLLAYLESGRGAPRSAVLTGPPGNGKTALLRWFQRDIESGENDIDVIWLTREPIEQEVGPQCRPDEVDVVDDDRVGVEQRDAVPGALLGELPACVVDVGTVELVIARDVEDVPGLGPCLGRVAHRA